MTSPNPPGGGDPLAPRRERTGPVRLTPALVGRLEFRRTPLGRRGYAEDEVERFRARVAAEIARSAAEKADLREQLERYKTWVKTHNLGRADEAGELPSASGGQPVSVQAVNVISQAQQAADAHIAQAETRARRYLDQVQARAAAILAHAERQAAEAARRRTPEEFEVLVAYLRLFHPVNRAEIKAAITRVEQETDTSEPAGRYDELHPGSPEHNNTDHPDPSQPGAPDGRRTR